MSIAKRYTNCYRRTPIREAVVVRFKDLVSGTLRQRGIADLGFNVERLSHLSDVIVRLNDWTIVANGSVNIQIPIDRCLL